MVERGWWDTAACITGARKQRGCVLSQEPLLRALFPSYSNLPSGCGRCLFPLVNPVWTPSPRYTQRCDSFLISLALLSQIKQTTKITHHICGSGRIFISRIPFFIISWLDLSDHLFFILGQTHAVPHGSGNYQAGVWPRDLFFGPLCRENTFLYHRHFLIRSHKARSDCPCTEGGFWSEILGTLRNHSEAIISYPLILFSFTNIGIRDHNPFRVGTRFS